MQSRRHSQPSSRLRAANGAVWDSGDQSQLRGGRVTNQGGKKYGLGWGGVVKEAGCVVKEAGCVVKEAGCGEGSRLWVVGTDHVAGTLLGIR